MSVNAKLTAIADEIRELSGATEKLGLDAMATTLDEANQSLDNIYSTLTGLVDRFNLAIDSDNINFDQMSELADYMQVNRGLIESITTDKVNVSDIIDNLTTNETNKPLSAAQGAALKALIDAIQIPVLSVNGETGAVTLTAADVGARANTWMPSASDVGADPAGTASGAIAAHIGDSSAHSDIRTALQNLSNKLGTMLNAANDGKIMYVSNGGNATPLNLGDGLFVKDGSLFASDDFSVDENGDATISGSIGTPDGGNINAAHIVSALGYVPAAEDMTANIVLAESNGNQTHDAGGGRAASVIAEVLPRTANGSLAPSYNGGSFMSGGEMVATVNGTDEYRLTIPNGVYAGTFDLVTGEAVCTVKKVYANSWQLIESGTNSSGLKYIHLNGSPLNDLIACNRYIRNDEYPYADLSIRVRDNGDAYIYDNNIDLSNPTACLEGLEFLMPIETSVKYQGNGQKIMLEVGENTVTTNVGDVVFIKYGMDTKTYLDSQLVPGEDGISATHSWNGTVLTMTSASGTSSADLKGAKGDPGDSVTVKSVSESTADGGNNVVTFSDGKSLTIKNGAKGGDGVGISSVKQTTTSSADGGNNVVTVTLTNGTTSTFSVKNGSKGSDATVTSTSIANALGYTPANANTVSQLSAEIDAIGTQEDIVQAVISALGTPVFGTVSLDKVITLKETTLADGTYTLQIEDKDGNVTYLCEYTKTAAPTYTNMLHYAINTDGTPYIGDYGEIGYKTGYRIKSTDVDVVQEGVCCTGYIPVEKYDDMYYFSNIEMKNHANDYTQVVLYDENFTRLKDGIETNVPISWFYNQFNNGNQQIIGEGVSFDSNGNMLSMSVQSMRWWLPTETIKKAAYIRFAGQSITKSSVITVNEPIE